MTRVLLIRHGHHDPHGRFRQHACSGLDYGVTQASFDAFGTKAPATAEAARRQHRHRRLVTSS